MSTVYCIAVPALESLLQEPSGTGVRHREFRFALGNHVKYLCITPIVEVMDWIKFG
jgi:hypothetical protein